MNTKQWTWIGQAIGVAGLMTAIMMLGWGQVHGRQAAAQTREVWAAWPSTEPVSTTITNWTQDVVWVIPQYGITVTFPAGSLSYSAVFTLTPRLSETLPAPSAATPYFFDIWGKYTGGGAVSPSGLIWLDARYNEADLLPMSEHSLHIHRWNTKFTRWESLSAQESFNVQTAANTFCLKFRTPGFFGVGGYVGRVFLPLIRKN